MCASSTAMTEFLTDNAPDPLGAYPHARTVGGFLFLSGIGPRQPGTGEIPGNRYGEHGELKGYDISAQCRAVFNNARIILENAGARWEDLVDVTVFLTNMDRDFKVFNRVYSEYFTTNRPCRTTVEVGALPTPIAIELKCTAFVGQE